MSPSSQRLSASNAAKKLGVYLPATPAEFQATGITRDELEAWQQNPPAWLAELRQNGPHPRAVVAARLGVSNSGLARAGVTDALTTQQIRDLIDEAPSWLIQERATHLGVVAEEERVKSQAAKDAARREARAAAAAKAAKTQRRQ